MQAELVNPFIEAVHDIFAANIGSEARRGTIGVSDSESAVSDLVALIGISGKATGNIALSLPVSTALNIVGKLTTTEYSEVNDEVLEGVAELINMIGSGAKAKSSVDGEPPMALGLPTVIRGEHHKLTYPTKTVWLEVPFDSKPGPFLLRITFEE